jgi:hypothetical protein
MLLITLDDARRELEQLEVLRALAKGVLSCQLLDDSSR